MGSQVLDTGVNRAGPALILKEQLIKRPYKYSVD